MHTLIVYESYFGCTQQIAEAMAEEFRTVGATTLAGVETARHHSVAAYDLLVVGGPTQARGLSRPGTRRGVLIRGARHRQRVRVDPRIKSAYANGSTGWACARDRLPRHSTRGSRDPHS